MSRNQPPHPNQPAHGNLPVLASAPGKLILCGEHAVVYNRPAIAVPLNGVSAHVSIESNRPGTGITFDTPNLRRRWLQAAAPDDPLSELVGRTLAHFGITHDPAIKITINSTIPIASGMGSGAAVATALVRALAAYAKVNLSSAEISAMVYASEQRFHGTPSGIDNTVVAFEQPIWFQRHPQAPTGETPPPAIEPITIAAPLALVIGDTGVRSATKLPVGEVRKRYQAEPEHYTSLMDSIALIVHQARLILATGDWVALGTLLTSNHALLQQIGVSSRPLDQLVHAALAAGALGAKLSGAGWGGIMLALVTPATNPSVIKALQKAGATRVLEATVAPIS